MVKPKTPKQKKATSVGNLDRSKKLQEFKKAQGLPTWKELQADEAKGLSTLIEEKMRRMARYEAINGQLLQQCHAAGWDVTNVLHNIVDLQNNILELEEALRQEGINPLTDNTYMRAREQLIKEIQFVSKQKLDVASFQLKVQDKKQQMGDDDMFTVEVGGKDE